MLDISDTIRSKALTGKRGRLRSRVGNVAKAALISTFCVVLTAGAVTPETAHRHLFLLAGTPTLRIASKYPVRLYSVIPTRRLQFIRNVVSAKDGLYDVRRAPDGSLFVLFPHITPTTVSVVHKDKPEVSDALIVNAEQYTVDEGSLTAGVVGGKSYLFLPLIETRAAGGIVSHLKEVRADSATGGPRVSLGDWSDYAHLRYYGSPGGPMPGALCEGMIAGNRLVMNGLKDVNVISRTPDRVRPTKPLHPAYILSATRRFFVFSVAAESTRGSGSTVYVHDKMRDQWRMIQVPGTEPLSTRAFGQWLAMRIMEWSPENSNRPGSVNQRARASVDLPSVKQLYGTGLGNFFLPGVLVLQNLSDGRKLTLDTGQEDSEILDVGEDGVVLYRVNDAIFSARIEGDNLSAPTLVVEDQDVPEVHWVFWSTAQPRTAPKAPTNRTAH